jgi:hypothetical protein
MSFRFRAKVGPFIWDERLGAPADRRPVKVDRGLIAGLCVAAALLVVMGVGAVWFS